MKKIFLFLSSTLIMLHTLAQRPSGADCRKTTKLVKAATRAYKNGELAEAEKLFKESLETNVNWPVISWYIAEMQKDGELRSANVMYDRIAKEISAFPAGQVKVCLGEVPANEKDGKESWLKSVYITKANYNYESGDIGVAIDSYKKYFELGGDEEYLFYVLQAAFYGEDRNAIEYFIKQNLKAGNKYVKYARFGEIFLDILDKKYSDAILNLGKIEEEGGDFKGSKFYARHTLSITYALKGDHEKSEAEIRQMLKDPLVGKNFPFFGYVRGLNEITKGNYDKAIDHLTEEIKPNKGLYSRKTMALFRYYAARAQAYMGKKDYAKARQDFETALLYKADYEAAQMGIAKLEGKIITERKTDKEPPVISLTEPAVTRGLKVSSAGLDVTFRGIAKDPAGLKSVSINGTDLYAQETGNFWGNITLKEGINNVVIKATDVAGNVGQLEVQIEKIAPEKKDEIIPVVAKEAKNYALIIASQTYEDPSIPSLENPVTDAVKLKFTLKNNYNFNEDNISILFNPAVVDLKKKFYELIEAVQPEDNVIIFYAGHGIWVDKEKKGYWLLADAKRNDANTWLPNKTVLDLISKVPSRHTLLITDACFSGSVFKTRSIGADAPVAVREMSEKISRVAITSGNDTEVPDESVFMKYLVKALNDNKDKYLTAQKMFITQIIEAVMAESKTEPRYGTLELAGHVGGDYIFIKK